VSIAVFDLYVLGALILLAVPHIGHLTALYILFVTISLVFDRLLLNTRISGS